MMGPQLHLRWLLLAVVLLCTLGEKAIYGFAHAQGDPQVLRVAQHFPLYLPTTFRSLANRLGWSSRQPHQATIRSSGVLTAYPSEPLAAIAPEQRLNIIWLVSESLRADMLTPEIMPQTWQFAQRGARFTRHFSGGNGTRMGIFTMFYGLYGTYWESFLNARRSPAMLDLIQSAGYRMRMQTSAHFTYPEFDKTVWAGVPKELLFEDDRGPYWQRDRRNIDRALQWLNDASRADQPFFFFQFFESPHADYSFPPEAVVRPEFLEDFNYATANVETDIELIRNRYINAVHHLDQQLGKLLDGVRASGLLDNTIVVITGDHGEEFMEAGHWGHNSTFADPQVRVPLVILAPGIEPQVVSRMTSHLDLPATVLNLLGVRSSAESYSHGYDLFGPARRQDTLISAWTESALVTQDYKITLGTTAYTLGGPEVATSTDTPVADPATIYQRHTVRLGQLMQELSRF